MRPLPALPRERPTALSPDGTLRRILSLPRRVPLTPDEVELISAAFRRHEVCPGTHGDPENPCPRCGDTGRITLRPLQAEALREIFDVGGLTGHLGVGSGKTLVTLLVPTLLGATRPALMVPASLREKTRRDYNHYLQDWHVRLPTIVGYEMLGHPKHADDLLALQPDVIVLDEADCARDPRTAVTRRVSRAWAALNPKVVCMSGTLITDRLEDTHHFALWSLRERSPLPMSRAECERWGAVVDGGREPDGIVGYHEHLRTRRGVLCSHAQECDASITIRPWSPPLPAALRETIDAVARSKLRPDGEALDDFELPECLCQLSQGFYQVWDPLPPDWWLKPRRAWWGYANEIHDLELPGFDSKGELVLALDNPGRKQPPDAERGRELLAAWREVEAQYEPVTVPVWLDRDPLRLVAEHVRPKDRTIIWVKNRAPGSELARLTGYPYFADDSDPELARKGGPIICSIAAHHRGKNLQAWNRALVLHPPAKNRIWEQLIGREHRQGQRSPHIDVETYCTISYHWDVLKRVRAQARKTASSAGAPQKLTLADWVDFS